MTMTIRIHAVLPVCALALSLAACGEEPAPEAEVADAGDCVPGIEVTDGWMALPAVAGNPAAAYFTITNTTDRQVTIRTADVLEASSAVLHETAEWSMEEDMQELFQQPVGAGETLEFAPGGKHVMVMQPEEALQPGGESEVTLTFVGGDKCSFPVSLHAAGDDPRENAGEAGAEADAG